MEGARSTRSFSGESSSPEGSPPTRFPRLAKLEMPKKPDWYRRRSYLHFDLPVGPRQALSIAANPKQVQRHSFYPFIYSTVTTIKVSRNPQTKKVERKKKEREISYSAHVDSHIYSFYASKLASQYENRIAAADLDASVLAFRTLGKNNVDFAWSAFAEIRRRGNCDVVAFDIKGFFDNLDHRLLKRAWTNVLGEVYLPKDHWAVFRSLTTWARVNKDKLYKALGISIHNPVPKGIQRRRLCLPDDFRKVVRDHDLIEKNDQKCGIPQGSPISAVLSNIYMLTFDQQMRDFAKSIGARYMRYCDDIIVIAPPGLIATIKAFVAQQIKAVKLDIQPNKTEECSFVTGSNGTVSAGKAIQYLGFTFDGQNVQIRSSSMMRYFEKMARGIKVAKNATAKRNKMRKRRGEPPKPLHLKTLLSRYSYLGRRNFLTYGFRSANTMHSDSVKTQLRPLWPKFKKLVQG